MTTEEFAKSVNIPCSEVMRYAKWLRSLGYEVRNNHTNPQIPEGVWLIPYKFPTLLPRVFNSTKH